MIDNNNLTNLYDSEHLNNPKTNAYTFKPRRVIFYPEALNYPLGKSLYDQFRSEGIKVEMTDSRNRARSVPGNPQEIFLEAKRTMIVGVRKDLRFSTCRPSADYQLPLASSCPGQCEYCYLQTTLGPRPYVRVYVNLAEILNQTDQLIEQRAPKITLFEGAATSDPIPSEKFTNALQHTINHFSKLEFGRFRFVTKFNQVEDLIKLDHQGHTTWRFSVNTERVIQQYEIGTPRLPDRLQAAKMVADSGYPLGFLIAPIFLYPDWQQEYLKLLQQIAQTLPASSLTFELITHRFTKRAKNQILNLRPHTTLPLDEEQRHFKYGQFGYGKYIYPKEALIEIKNFFEDSIHKLFGLGSILYLV